jgi:hypothetical protein
VLGRLMRMNHVERSNLINTISLVQCRGVLVSCYRIHVYRQKGIKMTLKCVQFMGNRGARRLTAGLAAFLTLLICSGVMPSSAMAATGLEHVCEVIGADSYGNQAIICTDLTQVDVAGGTYYAAVQTEAYCQDLDEDLVQCANITVLNETAYGTTVGPLGYLACGHSNPSCPAGRWYVTGPYLPTTDSVTCIENAWGVTVASGLDDETDQEVYTSIQLPESDLTFQLTGNFATPHANVGNC